MPLGRPLSPLSIGQEQRQQLVSWSRRRKTAQALAMRARIVLLAAEGLSNTAIAQQVSTTLQTVGKWRRRFLEGGIDSLLDEARPGTSRKLGDEDIERVLALTLESRPDDATHWTVALSAIWRKSLGALWRKLRSCKNCLALSDEDRQTAMDRFRLLQPHLEQNRSLRLVAAEAGAGLPHCATLGRALSHLRFGIVSSQDPT